MNPSMGYGDLVLYLVAQMGFGTAAVATCLVVILTLIFMTLNRPVQEGERVDQAGVSSRGESDEPENGVDTEEGNLHSLVKDSEEFKALDSSDPIAVKRFVQDLRTKDIQPKLMTDEERHKEREMQRKQLNDIFALMQEQENKFGMTSLSQVEEQLGMYKK